jgi:Family of unknown function (DUF5360)
MKTLKIFFLVTDIGFIIYWFINVLHIIPENALFKNYHNTILVAWNFSFLPLDLLVSLTGLLSLYLYQKQKKTWKSMALISLTLTFCSGLQAISFWTLRLDFNLGWWIPNLFLMIYPMFFAPKIINNKIPE